MLCRKPYEEEEGEDAQRAEKTKQSVENIKMAKTLGYL